MSGGPRWALTLGILVAAAPAVAGPPPVLGPEHVHPSGSFTFRLPEGWRIRDTNRPEVLEAWGEPLGVRFFFQERESGYDSLHEACKLERLAAPMDTAPRVKYEYEYRGGFIGDRRVLDSAFAVRYDQPAFGHREWRQRTVTIVGGGLSLCVMTYAPAPVWKKSPEARAALEAVLASVVLR